MITIPKFTQTPTTALQQDKPKAELWINIGYEVPDPEGISKFISLPLGIPLDQVKLLNTSTPNEEFNLVNQARNDLLDQLLNVANTVEPGQSKIVNLSVEVRRVSENVEVNKDINPFIRKLELV